MCGKISWGQFKSAIIAWINYWWWSFVYSFHSIHFIFGTILNFLQINCSLRDSSTFSPNFFILIYKNQQYQYGFNVVTNGIRLWTITSFRTTCIFSKINLMSECCSAYLTYTGTRKRVVVDYWTLALWFCLSLCVMCEKRYTQILLSNTFNGQWIAFYTDVYEIQICAKQTQTTHPDNSTNLLVYLLCIYNIYTIKKITKHSFCTYDISFLHVTTTTSPSIHAIFLFIFFFLDWHFRIIW